MAKHAGQNDVLVTDPPADVISSVSFSPDASKFIVGAWDGQLHIYGRQYTGSFARENLFNVEAPVLDVCWGPGGKHIFCVGLDQHVRRLDFTYGSNEISNPTILSSHGKASNRIAYSDKHDVLISTSWDGTMHVHSPESGAFVRLKLAAKPFALSLSSERAVVAMAERKVTVYDLNDLKNFLQQNGSTSPDQIVHEISPWQERESSLKFMTRDIACMPDGAGFAVSSIEGRVGVEWFDPIANEKKYAFKCHRQASSTTDENGDKEEVDIVYPVNALAFHPTSGIFATGGGDGTVALWDAKSKRRVRQFALLGASVAAMAFSPDGKFLAIGISPGFEDGFEAEEIDTSLIKIIVKELSESDLKTKAAK